jgi:ATP-dependent Lon protease
MGDLDEIPQELKRRLRFVPVRHMDEVLEAALADRLPRTGAAVVRPGLRPARVVAPR